MLFSNPLQLIVGIVAILIAITFHEYAHGKAAALIGDPTPKNQGRLTLNPLKHLDPVGAIMLVVVGFGWAKPVQVNPYYFNMDRQKGMMLVSFAGPLMNIIIAFISAFMLGVLSNLNNASIMISIAGSFFSLLLWYNAMLAVFNLIPLPPLDGSKILAGILPSRYLNVFYTLESYGSIILILLLATNILGSIIRPIVSGLINLLLMITNF